MLRQKGYINIINRWQSEEYNLKIEEPYNNMCSNCCFLSRLGLPKNNEKEFLPLQSLLPIQIKNKRYEVLES